MFSSTEKTCINHNENTERLIRSSVLLFKEKSYNEKILGNDLIPTGARVYVLSKCEILEPSEKDCFCSINYFDSVVATPIPRLKIQNIARLINSSSEIQESVLLSGNMSSLKVDELKSRTFKRGFHFRISEVFDFREYSHQRIVKVGVRVVMNVTKSCREFQSSYKIKKIFRMKIVNFPNQDPEEVARDVPRRYIYSTAHYFPKLLKLEDAGKHPYRLTKDIRAASIFWYHLYKDASKRIENTPNGTGNYLAINHLKNQYFIGMKDGLSKTLHLDSKVTSGFYPQTYLLYDKRERNDFLSSLLLEDNDDQIWILKPTSLSEGRGIKILSKINNTISINGKELLLSDKNNILMEYSGKKERYICQKYISKPMLYNGYKVGFRQYWLIASMKPLRVLLYKTGHCTFGSSKYTQNLNFDDVTVHLTNYDQQPEDNKPNILYVKQYSKYLFEKKVIRNNEIWLENVFRKQVKDIIFNVARCYNKSILEKSNGRNDILTFGFFAADFIMDDNQNLWLAEVQMSPSLKFTESCKKREYTPKMMIEALNIVSEIQMFLRKNGGDSYGLKNLNTRKNFEWIINDAINE